MQLSELLKIEDKKNAQSIQFEIGFRNKTLFQEGNLAALVKPFTEFFNGRTIGISAKQSLLHRTFVSIIRDLASQIPGL